MRSTTHVPDTYPADRIPLISDALLSLAVGALYGLVMGIPVGLLIGSAL